MGFTNKIEKQILLHSENTPEIISAKILIVDDDPNLIRYLYNCLPKYGYQIIASASSAEEAFQLAAQHLPDLIIMDIILEGDRDGIDAAHQIRRHLEIPVIYLTAYSEESFINRAKSTYPFGYLVKPFKDIDLHAMIQMLLLHISHNELNRCTLLENKIIRMMAHFTNISWNQLDEGIQMALKEAGEFARADRAYLFRFSADGLYLSNTHEWCAPNINVQIDKLQHLNLDDFPWYAEQIRRHATINIPQLSSLPEIADAERNILQAQEIKSMINVPLIAHNQLWGMLGLDAVTAERSWSNVIINMLTMVGDIFVHTIDRYEIYSTLENNNQHLITANRLLEKSSLERSKFLSAIGHELRTPLNAILGFTELMAGQFYGPMNDQQLHHIKSIHNSGKHLLELISDLFEISKIDGGSVDINWEPISILQIVNETADLFNKQIKQRELILEKTIDLPKENVVTDRRRLHQILINFISNAVKFSHPQGTISIRVYLDTEAFIKFEIQDQGVGISVEKHPYIFTDFYQAERIRDTELGGTGLGLALTRRLVHLLEGQVGFTSKVNQGSTFWFTIPYRIDRISATQQLLSDQLPEKENVNTNKKRILIVEDNDINLALIRDMIESSYEVDIARNGEEALRLAATFSPDLILMDMHMPVMNGLTATRKLRSQKLFRRIPIIALTASADDESIAESQVAGCTDLLTKPYSCDAIKAMLKKYL